jgi:NitT/TauT family transport system permease protein
MALSFYQSLRTVPSELREAANMLHLSGWQTFWRIDVPFAMPGLLWNTMLSMSASWFFVVASEAFTVAKQTIYLPGIGSYIAVAIAQANKAAIVYAIITMFVVILLYDQLIFRPLITWAEKFKAEQTGEEKPAHSWIVDLFQRTRLVRYSSKFFAAFWDEFVNFRWFNRNFQEIKKPSKTVSRVKVIISYVIFFVLVTISAIIVLQSIFKAISFHEILHVMWLGVITGFKVMLLILLCSIIWIPIGVWIGLRENVSRVVQPVVQFLAAFPANLLFPIVVIAIINYRLNVDIWTAPLMVLGTQWYILFNVIAGTMVLPKDLKQVAENFHLKGWLWWAKLILPGIFPYYLTGAITAAGGAWNVSIIAESVSWGKTHLEAHGLGAYITHYSAAGDFPRLALGICIMTIYVLIINRIIWRPLYNLARERYQLG